MNKFAPPLQMSREGMTVETRISRCRERIKEIEHKLAIERRMLSQLFAEEREQALKREAEANPEKELTHWQKVRHEEGMRMLNQLTKRSIENGTYEAIMKEWGKEMDEARKYGEYKDAMDKAHFWLERLK
ncbi:TPA: hypothetical protein RRU44_001534 [Klebsiella pneumoniae]|nr:hypothetical protein [Klebsiella pneumoniae]